MSSEGVGRGAALGAQSMSHTSVTAVESTNLSRGGGSEDSSDGATTQGPLVQELKTQWQELFSRARSHVA